MCGVSKCVAEGNDCPEFCTRFRMPASLLRAQMSPQSFPNRTLLLRSRRDRLSLETRRMLSSGTRSFILPASRPLFYSV